MAKNDSDRENQLRRREREDEAEQEESLKKGGKVGRSEKIDATGPTDEKFLEMQNKADVMINQLNTLYNTFIAGELKIPPLEQRRQLDQTMATLKLAHKPTVAANFRYNGLNSRYVTHTERWDKMMKAWETGKRNIHTGAGRKAA